MSGFISGALGDVSNVVGGVSSIASTASNAASLISSLSSGGYGARQGLGLWAATLQAASFRGVPFGVFEATVKTGRRTAVHEYPFRNEVWVEDLGLGTRVFTFRGFLVGDDVYAQRDRMVTAVQTAGPGVLVHPSLGSKNVSIVDFSASERAKEGRVVEMEMVFIQTINPIMPATVAQTKKGTLASVEKGLSAVEADFHKYVVGPLDYGLSVVQRVVSTVSVWQRAASGLLNDAKMMAGAVKNLEGSFGLYARGNLENSARPQPSPLPTTATDTQQAISSAIANKQAAVTAIQAVGSAAGSLSSLTASTFPGIAFTATEALRGLAVDPADQIRLLSNLQNFTPTILPQSSPLGAAAVSAQTQVASVLRRATLLSLASACQSYQAASSNDALTVLSGVTALLDAEITIAADAGEDGTYAALRAVRAAVSKDLITRAAQLPSLKQVVTGEPMPALGLAYALYLDSTRAAEISIRSGAVHPGFMPTSFEALSA